METHITITRWLVALSIPLVIPGCTTLKNGRQLEAGPGLQFDAAELATYRESQNKVLTELVELTVELDAATPAATHWDDVIAAGMDYADGKCEACMQALFRLNRDRRTSTTQIGLLGTAAAGIMAAVDSAARDVAIVAIAFGLASSTVDNLSSKCGSATLLEPPRGAAGRSPALGVLSSNLLYELDPSSVRALVQTMQAKYRQALGVGYLTRPAASTAIRRAGRAGMVGSFTPSQTGWPTRS